LFINFALKARHPLRAFFFRNHDNFLPVALKAALVAASLCRAGKISFLDLPA
jgi:hypothetical protein